ncbi:MAG: hypothetical protein KJ638_00390, partial [Chloroflexi bacterium]|nr:hypothetical protein [Chloroflexota bacterium]
AVAGTALELIGAGTRTVSLVEITDTPATAGNTLDLNIITTAFGSNDWTPASPWNPAADLNEDDKIDIKDLAIAGRNSGSEHIFHRGRDFANSGVSVYRLDACLDGQDQVHIAWSDTTNRDVYYTRLDRYGNTLIDDVLVDSGSSTGVDIIAIGCDKVGNAHLFWDCVSNVCEARYDQWGYPVIKKQVVDSYWTGAGADAAAGIDSNGRAHLLYNMTTSRLIYAMFTPEGTKAVALDEPLIGEAIVSRYRQLVIDGDDNIHLVWSEEDGTDRLYYTKLATDASTSIPAMVFGQTGWDGGVTDSHRPSLAVDSLGNALILWNRANPTQLLLEKIAPDGSTLLDDYDIFPDYKAGYFQDLAIDGEGQFHLWAPTDWGGGLPLNAYGIFGNDASVVDPIQWAMFGRKSYYPQLMIDSQEDIHLVYQLTYRTMDDPPCPEFSICYESTAFDAAAYDLTLPDLGLDLAHLSWSPILAKWGQTLVVTTTIFNAGWTVSPATTAHFEIVLNDDTVLPSPAQADTAIPALSPRATQEVSVTLPLPLTPPEGYEALEYADLRLTVDPSAAITETSETNNQITTPIMIQPLPTTAGLFLIVKDLTPTARGAVEIYHNSGTAGITGGIIDREVPITDYISLLAGDLPISSTPVTYTVSWGQDGYVRPEPVDVGIGRNPIDPYRVDYNPSNTVVLETNNWGSLQGTISEAEKGDPVTATVRILGQGISIQTTTDSNGQFSPTTEEKLGKLIPGSYNIFISAAGYARISGSQVISGLTSHTWDRTMEPTMYAYVRGMVVNQFGRPVSGADVEACGTWVETASDGSFDLGEVDESCTSLVVAKSGYAISNISIALTAGLEAYFGPITLEFDPAVNVIQDEGSLASWKQDESSADLLPDPPEDAEWYEIELFDKFADEFWPSFRVQVWWGTYEYYLDAAYTGAADEHYLYDVQLRLIPKTFEAHKVSGDIAEAELFNGHSVKFALSYFEDSGMTTALWVSEARLVNADSGAVIKTVRNPVEGGSHWVALEDMTRTYDFGGVAIDDWENAEVWLFIKVGKNEGDSWQPSMILKGWHFDQQVLRFDLSAGTAIGDYMIVNFPNP